MKYILHTVLVLLASATMATAGSWWEKVSDLSISENGRVANLQGCLYLYDLDQVYCSEDNGSTWKDITTTFPNGVYTFRQVGPFLYAFTEADADQRVTVYRSGDKGKSWHSISQMPLSTGSSIRDVSHSGSTLFAITNGLTVLRSSDNGTSWIESSVDASIGMLTDFAAVDGLWIACGTEGAVWSNNNGEYWFPTSAPIEVGSGITQVEAHAGTIWAGGNLGACRFDLSSRSWDTRNEGLPKFASLVGAPLTLRSIGGVLFGVFKTFNGQVRLLRVSQSGQAWIPMESAGLPPHNLASYDNFTVVEQNVYLYYYGDDIGFVGLYKGVNDAPTSVEEDLVGSGFSVGPNPAFDHVTVTTTQTDNAEISLLDVQGRVLTTAHATSSVDLNVTAYPAGVYYIRVTDVRGTVAKPIVISR